MGKQRTWDTERHGGFLKKQWALFRNEITENEDWPHDDKRNNGWDPEETHPKKLEEYYESVANSLFVDNEGKIIVDLKKFCTNYKTNGKIWNAHANRSLAIGRNAAAATNADTATENPPKNSAPNLEEMKQGKDGSIKVPTLQGKYLAKAKQGGDPDEKIYVMVQVPSGTQADQIRTCMLSDCGTKLKIEMLWNPVFSVGLQGLFNRNDSDEKLLRNIYQKTHPAVVAYDRAYYGAGLGSADPKPHMIELPLITLCDRITPLNSMSLEEADPVVCLSLLCLYFSCDCYCSLILTYLDVFD